MPEVTCVSAGTLASFGQAASGTTTEAGTSSSGTVTSSGGGISASGVGSTASALLRSFSRRRRRSSASATMSSSSSPSSSSSSVAGGALVVPQKPEIAADSRRDLTAYAPTSISTSGSSFRYAGETTERRMMGECRQRLNLVSACRHITSATSPSEQRIFAQSSGLRWTGSVADPPSPGVMPAAAAWHQDRGDRHRRELPSRVSMTLFPVHADVGSRDTTSSLSAPQYHRNGDGNGRPSGETCESEQPLTTKTVFASSEVWRPY